MIHPAIDDGPAVGTRVRVSNADQSRDLGFGTYMGRVPIKDIPDEPAPACVAIEPVEIPEDAREAFSEMMEEVAEGDTPMIKLDSGETVYGFQCWWSVVEDDDDAEEKPAASLN